MANLSNGWLVEDVKSTLSAPYSFLFRFMSASNRSLWPAPPSRNRASWAGFTVEIRGFSVVALEDIEDLGRLLGWTPQPEWESYGDMGFYMFLGKIEGRSEIKIHRSRRCRIFGNVCTLSRSQLRKDDPWKITVFSGFDALGPNRSLLQDVTFSPVTLHEINGLLNLQKMYALQRLSI